MARRRTRVAATAPATFVALAIWIAAAVAVPGCANLKLTVEQCREYCAKRGKEMKSFHVGTAVPVIHPKPDVDCECEEPAVP